MPMWVLRTYQGRNVLHLSLATQRLVHLPFWKFIEMDACEKCNCSTLFFLVAPTRGTMVKLWTGRVPVPGPHGG
jgi:hypothetical protein